MASPIATTATRATGAHSWKLVSRIEQQCQRQAAIRVGPQQGSFRQIACLVQESRSRRTELRTEPYRRIERRQDRVVSIAHLRVPSPAESSGHDAAGNPRATTTERFGLVGIIVAFGVNDE